MSKTCPDCGYTLDEFDTSCPKCKAKAQTDVSVAASVLDEPVVAEKAPVAKAPPGAAEPPVAAKAPAAKGEPDEKKPESEDESEEEDQGSGIKKPVKINPVIVAPIAVAALAIYVVGFLWSTRPKGPPTLPVEMDVAALVGLSFKEIEAKLGKPPESTTSPTAQQQAAGQDEGTATWKGTNHNLIVTYHIKNSRVIDLFVTPNDNTETLRQIESSANIVESDTAKYTVEPVEVAGERGQFAGVRVIPAGSASSAAEVKAAAPSAVATAPAAAANAPAAAPTSSGAVTRVDGAETPAAAPTAAPVATTPPAPAVTGSSDVTRP